MERSGLKAKGYFATTDRLELKVAKKVEFKRFVLSNQSVFDPR
jgi:hypothetical protein